MPSRSESPRSIYLTREEKTINSKVFVGNLSFSTSSQELEKLFSEAGTVTEVFLPMDRVTGRPRGFAFVEFSDPEGAAEAIDKFHEYEVGGRNIRVNEAEERRPRAPSFSDGGGGGSSFNRGGPPPGRPKGSRRNLRKKKRSL